MVKPDTWRAIALKMQVVLLARAQALALVGALAVVVAAAATVAQPESAIVAAAQVTLRGRLKTPISIRESGTDRNRDCTSGGGPGFGGGFSSRGGGGQTCYVRHLLLNHSVFANLRQSCGGIGHMSRYGIAFSLFAILMQLTHPPVTALKVVLRNAT